MRLSICALRFGRGRFESIIYMQKAHLKRKVTLSDHLFYCKNYA